MAELQKQLTAALAQLDAEQTERAAGDGRVSDLEAKLERAGAAGAELDAVVASLRATIQGDGNMIVDHSSASKMQKNIPAKQFKICVMFALAKLRCATFSKTVLKTLK